MDMAAFIDAYAWLIVACILGAVVGALITLQRMAAADRRWQAQNAELDEQARARARVLADLRHQTVGRRRPPSPLLYRRHR